MAKRKASVPCPPSPAASACLVLAAAEAGNAAPVARNCQRQSSSPSWKAADGQKYPVSQQKCCGNYAFSYLVRRRRMLSMCVLSFIRNSPMVHATRRPNMYLWLPQSPAKLSDIGGKSHTKPRRARGLVAMVTVVLQPPYLFWLWWVQLDIPVIGCLADVFRLLSLYFSAFFFLCTNRLSMLMVKSNDAR